MKKIRVQSKLTKSQAFITSAVLILITLGLIYLVFTSGSSSNHSKNDGIILISVLTAFIPLLFANANNMDEYISELQLTDSELALVYKKAEEISNVTRIDLSDIESFHAKLIANRVSIKQTAAISCQTDICITTKDHKRIKFTETPPLNDFFTCDYAFMLRLLSIAKDLPNFTFEVEGNVQKIKDDVMHFAKYGKRLPWLKRLLQIF